MQTSDDNYIPRIIKELEIKQRALGDAIAALRRSLEPHIIFLHEPLTGAMSSQAVAAAVASTITAENQVNKVVDEANNVAAAVGRALPNSQPVQPPKTRRAAPQTPVAPPEAAPVELDASGRRKATWTPERRAAQAARIVRINRKLARERKAATKA